MSVISPTVVLTFTVVNCRTKAPERERKVEDEETDESTRQTRFKKEGKKSRWNGQTDTSDRFRDTSASDGLLLHLKGMIVH